MYMLLLSDIAWPLFLAKGLQSPWCATMKSRFDSLMSETASVRKGIGRFKLRFSSCLGWATHTGPHKTMIHFLRTSLDFTQRKDKNTPHTPQKVAIPAWDNKFGPAWLHCICCRSCSSAFLNQSDPDARNQSAFDCGQTGIKEPLAFGISKLQVLP